MISKKLKSRFRTLTVNSHVSTKSIQGLLLFFQILGLFLIMARDFANFDKTKLYFMIALISFVYIIPTFRPPRIKEESKPPSICKTILNQN